MHKVALTGVAWADSRYAVIVPVPVRFQVVPAAIAGVTQEWDSELLDGGVVQEVAPEG